MPVTNVVSRLGFENYSLLKNTMVAFYAKNGFSEFSNNYATYLRSAGIFEDELDDVAQDIIDYVETMSDSNCMAYMKLAKTRPQQITVEPTTRFDKILISDFIESLDPVLWLDFQDICMIQIANQGLKAWLSHVGQETIMASGMVGWFEQTVANDGMSRAMRASLSSTFVEALVKYFAGRVVDQTTKTRLEDMQAFFNQ